HKFIDRYYVWSDETKDHKDELLVYDRDQPGFHIGAPEGEMLLKRLKDLSAEQRAIATFETTIDGHRTYFQAQLRFTFPTRERLTGFVAFRVASDRLRNDFFPSLIKAKMKGVEGPSGFPPLIITILDEQNRVVVPRDAPPTRRYVDERPFQLVFF